MNENTLICTQNVCLQYNYLNYIVSSSTSMVNQLALTILAQACLPALAKTRRSFIAMETGNPYKEGRVGEVSGVHEQGRKSDITVSISRGQSRI